MKLYIFKANHIFCPYTVIQKSLISQNLFKGLLELKLPELIVRNVDLGVPTSVPKHQSIGHGI